MNLTLAKKDDLMINGCRVIEKQDQEIVVALVYEDDDAELLIKACNGYAALQEQNKALVEALRTVDTMLDHRHADIALIGEVISKALAEAGAA